MPWIRKYAPKGFKDLINPNAEKLKEYIRKYKAQRRRAVFLHGPPGTCKSSSVYAIAQELNYEVVETNASDFRTKDKILSRLGGALMQHSLFSRGKIILVDEVDGLSGMKDRGAAQAIVGLLAKSTFPVVLVANDAFQDKLKAFQKDMHDPWIMKWEYE